MNKKNIILIGMPGVGKSSAGVVLAKALGYKFADSDLIIQEKTGMLLKEIINKKGIEGFIEIENNDYIGYISLPALGIELPVMSSWSYDNLKISPCRYKGSAAGGDLIIAAHNYSSHFGRLDEFQGGEEIIFISADGTVLNYEVIQTENISGKDVEAMEFGSADEWDLTLFTCTLSGQSRVTVRAVIKESE